MPGFKVNNWFGVSAPSKTPPEIIARLHGEIVRALKSPELRAALSNAGADPSGTTPEQYTEFVQSEIAKWGKVIKAAGIRIE